MFDPRAPEFRANPYPFYDMLRQAAPIFYWGEWDLWFLSRYDDCNRLLRDNRLGHAHPPLSEVPEQQRPLFEMESHWMLINNPPDHTRLRRLVHKAFTPRMVEKMRHTIQSITNDLLDSVQEAAQLDLIADLAAPLPVTVIAKMLGIPREEHHNCRIWSKDIARTIDLTEEPAVYNRAAETTVMFTGYLKQLIRERRANPQDDLLSALIAAEEAGDQLSEKELHATVILLFVAGHETTINLIGNGTLALLRHPSQMQQLKNDPSLIKSAIEELLRYDSPVQMTSRVVFQEIEWKGHTFRQGQNIGFLLGSANHDPDIFAKPHRLDITRQPNRHLTFGSGIHYCLGAPLARLEGQIAINTLLRRIPTLTLATESPQYRDNYTLRGLTTLPLSW
ncbi:MAG: cytochrome P450 [Ardenticatenaceae bacterium]